MKWKFKSKSLTNLRAVTYHTLKPPSSKPLLCHTIPLCQWVQRLITNMRWARCKMDQPMTLTWKPTCERKNRVLLFVISVKKHSKLELTCKTIWDCILERDLMDVHSWTAVRDTLQEVISVTTSRLTPHTGPTSALPVGRDSSNLLQWKTIL